jgi:phosphocarrier protein HPr
MVEQEVIIINKLGLHTRPAKDLVHLATTFHSDITFHKENRKANAKSFINLISLAASVGTVLKLTVNGEDEETAINAISELIANKFGEES